MAPQAIWLWNWFIKVVQSFQKWMTLRLKFKDTWKKWALVVEIYLIYKNRELNDNKDQLRKCERQWNQSCPDCLHPFLPVRKQTGNVFLCRYDFSCLHRNQNTHSSVILVASSELVSLLWAVRKWWHQFDAALLSIILCSFFSLSLSLKCFVSTGRETHTLSETHTQIIEP